MSITTESTPQESRKRGPDDSMPSSVDQKRVKSSGPGLKPCTLWRKCASPRDWTWSIKDTSVGGIAAYAKLNGSNVRMQLPRMTAPFGVQFSYKPKNGPEQVYDKPNLDLDVSNPAFQTWCDTIDGMMKEFISKNSDRFNQPDNMHYIKLDGMTKQDKLKKYNPKIRTKIVKEFNKDGKADIRATEVRMYMADPPTDEFGNKQYPLATLGDIERMDEVMPVVDFSGLWFTGAGCGVSLTVISLLLFKRENTQTCVFNFEDEEVTLPLAQADSEVLPDNAACEEDDSVQDDPYE